MVDRRLVGFMAIILVATTLLSFLIFQVKEREAVRILAQRTPSDIPGGVPGSPSYSLDLMALRNLPDLIVRFHFLVNLTGAPLVKPWNETTGRELEDMIANFPRVQEIRAFLEALRVQTGGEPTYAVTKFEQERKLYVIDFTDAMAALAGQDLIKTMYTVYAFNVDDMGTVSVFGGYRDFFFPREKLVSKIKYTSPGESKCFGTEAAVGGEGCLPIEQAPVGILHLHDLAPGERVHVEVALNTLYMFGHSGIIQMVTTETGYGAGPTTLNRIGARAS